MPHLRAIIPKIAADLPPVDVRAALRAWKAGTATAEQQQRCYRYVVVELCGLNSMIYAMPGEESVVNWRQGCRYIGAHIEAATLEFVAVEVPPRAPVNEPLVTKARQRALKSTT